MSRHSEQGRIDLADILRYKEVSRRLALKAGLAMGATALGAEILAACAGSSNTPTYNVPKGKVAASATPVAAATPPPQGAAIPTPRNQTVIIDQVGMTAYGSHNPLIPNGWDYMGGNQQVLVESLFYLNLATGELVKWQATGWDYNSDYTKLTLHLNPNVHWNDGQPFTSQDVKFTVQLIQGNTGLSFSGGSGLLAQQAKSIDTPDDHTVVFNLSQHNTRFHYHFINAVVSPDLTVLPAHIWSKHDPTTFKNNPPVFTGPYKLKESNRTLQYYLWEKDPNYWNKANFNPRPRYFAVRTGPTTDASAAEFKEAKFDQGNDYTTTKAMIDGGYNKAIITSMIDPCLRAFVLNCDPSRGIMADPRFHAVLSALIDRNKIANGVWSVKTTPAVYPWPAYGNMKKWEDPSTASNYPLTYDPGKASQMLDAMGATKGSDGKRSFQGKAISLTIITPSGPTGAEYLIGQLLQKELQKQGIDCNLQSLAGAVFQDMQNKGQYDICSQWGCCTTGDPYQTYALVSSKNYQPIGTNAIQGDIVRLKDPTMDNLIDELANDSPDDPKSKPTFAQALDEWYKQMPYIPSIQTVYTHQANTTYWTGWPTDDNLYIQPNNWWGSFLFVLGKLKPTGAS